LFSEGRKEMKRIILTLSIMLVALAGTACEDTSPPATPEAETQAPAEREGTAEAAQQKREEQEQERRTMQASVEDAERRLGDLESRIRATQADAEQVASDIDPELRSELDDLNAELREAREAAESFAQSGIEAWESRRRDVMEDLDALEQRVEESAERLDGQKEVLAAREAGIEPVTGEVVALDGGNYDAYLVSVVERVQEALRKRGYYRGPVDGVLGEPTMKAIADYQREHGLHPSGVPSPMTRKKLLTS
jgi:chromosome segregation ATPase